MICSRIHSEEIQQNKLSFSPTIWLQLWIYNVSTHVYYLWKIDYSFISISLLCQENFGFNTFLPRHEELLSKSAAASHMGTSKLAESSSGYVSRSCSYTFDSLLKITQGMGRGIGEWTLSSMPWMMKHGLLKLDQHGILN